ncbi:hypothetical protein [Myceligenerans crystallogenes]|uniref:SDR family oxidoreductase n=1 Tax=Myceligenerans crystallogenes TaxID=316335 RepID=A0ABN2N9T0_9MICO
MRVAVIGGGFSGEAFERALTERGAEVVRLSRATGFDVLTDDAAASIGEADAIIEATGHFTTSRKVAVDFFTRSARNVATAAGKLGAKHVLLSIVNCHLPLAMEYGYFAGKAEQERVAREEGTNLTIVRSTQWFEYPRQNLERMKFGPIALVPAMTIQPVAVDAVAGVLAEVALGSRGGDVVEVAGPGTTTLWDMTKPLENKGAAPVPLPIPGAMGKAFRDGLLTPGPDAVIAGPAYGEWLARQA